MSTVTFQEDYPGSISFIVSPEAMSKLGVVPRADGALAAQGSEASFSFRKDAGTIFIRSARQGDKAFHTVAENNELGITAGVLYGLQGPPAFDFEIEPGTYSLVAHEDARSGEYALELVQ